MMTPRVIALWGVAAIVGCLLGYIVARMKRRDASSWAAWCFVLPPLLIVLLLARTNPGPAPRRLSLDEQEREETERSSWF